MAAIINGYVITKELSNENAGMCLWGFAEKNGHEYFIKQFLQPKYPEDNGRLSPELTERMRRNANAAFLRRKRFYDRLRECRTGNNVVVEDYFRWGNFYYAVTDRVRGPYLSVKQIAALPEEKKRVLLKAILFNVMQFHDQGIVHSDLKPDNVMVRQTSAGFCTAKIIDFDAGFFSAEPPQEILGDQVYFSPEALLHNLGKDAAVTDKADIFALGLLFHQYWCGSLPGFDREAYRYANEALLEGEILTLDRTLPDDLRGLLGRMLSREPEKRPTAREAWLQLYAVMKKNPVRRFRAPTDDDL